MKNLKIAGSWRPLPVCAIASFLVAASVEGSTSSLWTQYTQAKTAGTPTTLADFSYAGYRHGEAPIPTVNWTRFDVTDFGAIADDGLSDKAAIQAAIAAAEANGSGIVFFPPGRFCINEAEESDPWVNNPIRIRGSNIVLRGSGHGPGGTELYAERHMNLANESQLWTAPAMIQFSGTGKKFSPVEYLAGPVSRGSHTITTTNTPDFAPGDWVLLNLKDTREEAIAEALSPHVVESQWTGLINNGIQIAEIHHVEAVNSNQIVFKEPIHADIPSDSDASHYARVLPFDPIEEVGVEDIAFVGNWQADFKHHTYYLDGTGKKVSHDSAWTALQFSNTVNSWIRDCRFTDWNAGITVGSSATVSVLRIKLDGNPGHNALTMNNSSHCFAGLIDDTASHWHACGVAGQCAGNVLWQSEYSENTCFESHASQPRWTLFDNITGGWMNGRWGGSISNLPNHLRGLVLWNYENTGAGVAGDFQFFRTDSNYGRVIMPYVIGFHGNPQSFKTSDIEVLESNGAPVEPQSLYEAQYLLRNGESFSMLLYAEWTARYGLSAPENALDGDPDQDFVKNLLEYALGTIPVAGEDSSDIHPGFRLESDTANSVLQVTFPRRIAAHKVGLTYTLQTSASLESGAWSTAAGDPGIFPSDTDGFEQVQQALTLPVTEPVFYRLKVEIRQ